MQPTDELSSGQESGKIRVGPGSQVGFREQGWSIMARGGMVWGDQKLRLKTERQGQAGKHDKLARDQLDVSGRYGWGPSWRKSSLEARHCWASVPGFGGW